MIVTEQEAKTKWCPEVRTGLTAGMAVNHHIGGDVHDESRCIASGCMMWRWHAWTDYVPDDIHPNHSIATACVSTTHGYCGKAGKQLGVGKLGDSG